MEITATIKRAGNVNADINRPTNVDTNITRLGGSAVTVDPALDGESTNPVENKAIVEGLAGKQDVPLIVIPQYVGDYWTADHLAIADALAHGRDVYAHFYGDYPYTAEVSDIGYVFGATVFDGTYFHTEGVVVTYADIAVPVVLTTEMPIVPSDISAFVNDAGYVTSADIPVTSVNSKTGAVSLSASDVGAFPDTTTFALGYDPDCSVGLAEVGDAVTAEPNYTPTGTISQTMENISFMTGGTAELTASFYNGTLTLGVSLTPTTATKNVATSAPVFVGNGVHSVIKENE